MANKININSLMLSSGVSFGTSGVRGLVSSMTDEVCYAYTAAFLKTVVGKVSRVVLGHDLRPSSPIIARACASAIKDAGSEVVYVGALPTPALAAYAQEISAAAIVVTGSHIPFDRNGMKFYRADGEISKVDELAIQQAVVEVPEIINSFALPKANKAAEAYYIKRYVDFFGYARLNGACVAIYEHSSVARDLLRKILEALGAEIIALGRTDSFVPIDTEAVRPEDVAQASSWAKENQFDAIFSTDGDADRPLIGDESGTWLRGDVVGTLCAKYLAADIVVTPVSSNTLAEKSNWFAQVVRTRIGSPYVIAAMEQSRSEQAKVVVGFEANGGFLLGSDIVRNGKRLPALATRDAILPMLALLYMAKEANCTLSALVESMQDRYTYSDRLQSFATGRSTQLIASLKQDRLRAAQVMAPNSSGIVSIDLTDGFRAMFFNGDIVHLRPSGNAPELRCYAESDSQFKAKLLCDECLSRVGNI